MEWINAVVQGILLGGLYAMFAAGLSLIFGVMRLVNIAHGDLIVAAAYLSYFVVEALGVGRIPPDDLNQLLQPLFDPAAKRKANGSGHAGCARNPSSLARVHTHRSAVRRRSANNSTNRFRVRG